MDVDATGGDLTTPRSPCDAVDKATDAVARMSPPSAKKRGEKSQRGEGAPAGVSKARSPFKRALDIISPPKSKRKEEYSDDEDGRDAAAELSREA